MHKKNSCTTKSKQVPTTDGISSQNFTRQTSNTNAHTRNTDHLFTWQHIHTALTPISLWEDPMGVAELLARWSAVLGWGLDRAWGGAARSRRTGVGVDTTTSEGVSVGENFTFHLENALVHCAKISKNYFHAMGIEVIDWPAKSPDLTPIENAWWWLTKEVYKTGKQYNIAQDSIAIVLKTWEKLPIKYLENLTSSMPDRIYEVITKKGGINYYC